MKLQKKHWIGGVIALLIAMLIGITFWLTYESPEEKMLYESYYASYLQSYRKSHKEEQAAFYADFYARLYARYYTSSDYRRALLYALPEATAKAFLYPDSSPVAGSRTSDRGVAMLKQFEGFRAEPYRDAGGKLTIGYGHLLRKGQMFSRISEEEAEKLLREDIRLAEAVIKRNVRVELSQAQFDALVSLVYNIGSGQFEDSTLLKKLNKADFAGAAGEFERWQHVDGERLEGLRQRRNIEKQWFDS